MERERQSASLPATHSQFAFLAVAASPATLPAAASPTDHANEMLHIPLRIVA
jgi:hypothetical protein